MNNEQLSYKKEYEEFISAYKSSVTSGEAVGLLIARMAQYFSDANIEYAAALDAYNQNASKIESQTDDAGKAISSAKAKVLASATPESSALLRTKAEIENIDQMINALKSLQKGVLNEYSHMGSA